VGFLAGRARSTPSKPDIYYDAFGQGLRELGYTEGKNLVIEWRFAEGKYDRFPALAAELVALRVDVLVTHITAGVRALHRATKTIPIVSTSITDPVGLGFAASLARPGGNVTGVANVSFDATSKRVELLTTMLPKLSRLAVLLNPAAGIDAAYRETIQQAVQARGITLVPVYARSPEDIETAFSTITRDRADALLVVNDGFFLGQARQLAELSVKHRVPSIFPYSQIAAAGGLMSYGQNFVKQYRKAAVYVDKILKGAKPADLPIEQPTEFELVINRKTAAAFGLSIPAALAVRADKIIE
jgi:putative ABC transport system substrate-binding protein